MSNDIDIANTALAYLGDPATVVSMYPPSGSTQASHCARFYPIARDTLLDSYNWNFATKRVALALLTETPPSSWLFAYAAPSDALNIIAIYDPSALNDYVTSVSGYPDAGYTNTIGGLGSVGVYTPQDFITETDASGITVIYTNQVDAVARYSIQATDASKFSPLFTEALTWLLASKLAGPIIKGAEGRKAALACLEQYNIWAGKAMESDANAAQQHPQGQTRWIQGRR